MLANLIEGGFEGRILAVNPHPVVREGAIWVERVADLPEAPDLAVIVTPADTVPGIIGELGRLGTRTACTNYRAARRVRGVRRTDQGGDRCDGE